MSIIGSIAVLIVLLVAWEALFWALGRGLPGILLFKLRIASRRKLPAGVYRWDQADSISVGRPDTVVVFKMPFQPSPEYRPATHVAVTDSETLFNVGDELVQVDPFLEAYDDEIGPLVVRVREGGRIASIGIDPDARKAMGG